MPAAGAAATPLTARCRLRGRRWGDEGRSRGTFLQLRAAYQARCPCCMPAARGAGSTTHHHQRHPCSAPAATHSSPSTRYSGRGSETGTKGGQASLRAQATGGGGWWMAHRVVHGARAGTGLGLGIIPPSHHRHSHQSSPVAVERHLHAGVDQLLGQPGGERAAAAGEERVGRAGVGSRAGVPGLAQPVTCAFNTRLAAARPQPGELARRAQASPELVVAEVQRGRQALPVHQHKAAAQQRAQALQVSRHPACAGLQADRRPERVGAEGGLGGGSAQPAGCRAPARAFTPPPLTQPHAQTALPSTPSPSSWLRFRSSICTWLPPATAACASADV